MTALSRTELIRKMTFVENELSDVLLAATGGFADRCDYIVDGPEEYVVVTLDRDASPSTLNVNVTSDSRWAILKDVMKAVAKRYE